jgi:hypothetical protein
MYHFQNISNQETNGVEGMNVGLTQTIGEGTECPGIGSSQIPTIRSLSELHHQKSSSNQIKYLPNWSIMNLPKCHPSKADQTQVE